MKSRSWTPKNRRVTWTRQNLAIARKILLRADSYAAALVQISKALDSKVTHEGVTCAFRRALLPTPKSLVPIAFDPLLENESDNAVPIAKKVSWTRQNLMLARKILRESDNYATALEEISKSFGVHVSDEAVTCAFRKALLPTPKSMVPKAAVDPVVEKESREGATREKNRAEELVEELREARAKLQFLEVATSNRQAPRILAREKLGPVREMTAVACASDWHVEETVEAESIAYRNEYNLEIADKRVEKYFRSIIWNIEHHRASKRVLIRDLVLWLGGDLMTGYIHPELIENNALSPTQTVLWLQERIRNGIATLLDRLSLESITIPCSFGNHGRFSDKPRISTGYKNSFEWLMYHELSKEFRGEKRVTFEITNSAHQYVEVYGRVLHFHHGDDVKYMGGVGGLGIPLLKAVPMWDLVRKADVHIIGHHHSLRDFGRVIVNGCFAEDTRVLTPCGARQIKDVTIGDRVISRDGTVQVVEGKLAKSVSETVRLRAKGLPRFIVTTPNHEFWAIKGESTNLDRPSRSHHREQTTIIEERPRWLRAEHLSEGDWLHTPVPAAGGAKSDPDLMWVYGLFAAEGHTIVDGGASKRHNRIEFSMHIKEESILSRAKCILDKALGMEGRAWTRPGRTTSHLSYSGRKVAVQFRDMFGHRSHGKRLPAWMYDLDVESRRAVVEGWIDGDGHRGKLLSAVTVSEQLAWGMYQLALGTGLEPMLYINCQRGPGPKGACTSWRVSFVGGQDVRWVDGERFVRVDHRRLEKSEIEVYDLQVSGEHTYCVEGVGVHNSLIGYGPYSQRIRAEFEPPQQALFYIDSRRGKCWQTALWVDDEVDAIRAAHGATVKERAR